MAGFRTEFDSLGEVRLPVDALHGAQTQRAIDNFPISGLRMPEAFIRALAQIKAAAADANVELGLIDAPRGRAIAEAADAIASGAHPDAFPVDVFQTGSGTSSNMNLNEVIARLVAQACVPDVHPNDHVNLCQSSNDVVPSAIHVAAASALESQLLPALIHLEGTILTRAREFSDVAKTGRTHLMDAVPLTFEQEFGGWAAQVSSSIARLRDVLPRLIRLAIGGTAIGTGLNAHPQFGDRVCAALARRTSIGFVRADNLFEAIACQDTAVELSGQLKVAAVALMKIANDLRWMNSGPLAGLGEIELPALQPGSSIMPGKVNPVIPEAVAMVSAKVIGNDASVTVAGQSGSFQLNVMLPLIAHCVLESIQLLAGAARVLADSAIAGLRLRRDVVDAALARNPILVTALNPRIGYELGAQIAKQAYAQRRAVIDVAAELTDIPMKELETLLAPGPLTKGGVGGATGGGG